MKYFHSILILGLVLNQFLLIISEKRISQEEWHRFRFGGMPIESDTNQWTVSNGGDLQTEMLDIPNSGTESTIDTNVQTVDVGRDKLVLVNDEGSIKVVKASQLPSITKHNIETTTPVSNTVLQMPLDQYFTKDSNANPTKNPLEYNYGSDHRLPVAFATSSKSEDRPKVIYQKFDENSNPCRVATDSPPIYIPAPQMSTPAQTRSEGKMVRIVIEMPESMTKDIDEASRYAATQVKRLKPIDETNRSNNSKSKKKIKKNVHEIIRKVVQLEEDMGDSDRGDEGLDDALTEETNQKQENKLIIAKNSENKESNGEKKYVLIRRNGKLRRIDRRRLENLKAFDKYKKVIKVYSH